VRDVASEVELPPLNALRAFEAAGRLQSIRRAAAELVVTPGAVSRHVRLLENWLGVALFQRSPHSVTLTPAGAQYLAVVSTHLRGIATATSQIAATRPDSRLRVRTWTLFASWLIPRLPDFRRANPGIDVQLIASSQQADFRRADVDVEIIGCDSWDDRDDVGHDVGHGVDGSLLGDPSYESVLAVRSDLVCVCSPHFLEGHRLERPADLKRIGDRDLLHSLTAPELWDRWLRAAGIDGLDSRHGQVFGDSALAAAAARAGQGVAILPRTILDDDIRAGRLTVPFASDPVHCRFDFYLLAPPDRFERRRVQVFRDWLVRQAA
jgi:LysR family transcriptional regulator, glycine cleavage system transcriptional activator